MADDWVIKTDNSESIWTEIQDKLQWHRVLFPKHISDQVKCRAGVVKDKPSRRRGCGNYAINAATTVNPQDAAVRHQRLKEILPRLEQMNEGFETQEFFDLFSEYIGLTHCQEDKGNHRHLAQTRFKEWWRDHVAKSPQQIVVTEIQAPASPYSEYGVEASTVAVAVAVADVVQQPTPPSSDVGVDASDQESMEHAHSLEQNQENRDATDVLSSSGHADSEKELHQGQTLSDVEVSDIYEAPLACLATVPHSNSSDLNGMISHPAASTTANTTEKFVLNIQGPTSTDVIRYQPSEAVEDPDSSFQTQSTRSRASSISDAASNKDDTMLTNPDNFDNGNVDSETLQTAVYFKPDVDEASLSTPASEATDEAVKEQQSAVDGPDLPSSQEQAEKQSDVSVTALSIEDGPLANTVQQPAVDMSEPHNPQQEAEAQQQPDMAVPDLSVDQEADEQHQIDEQLQNDKAHGDTLEAEEVQTHVTQQLEQEADDRLSITSPQSSEPAPVISTDQQCVPAIAITGDENHDVGSSSLATNTLKPTTSRTSLSNRQVTHQVYVVSQSQPSHYDSTLYRMSFDGTVLEPQLPSQNMTHDEHAEKPQLPVAHQYEHNTVHRRSVDAQAAARLAVNRSEMGHLEWEAKDPSKLRASNGWRGRARRFGRKSIDMFNNMVN